MSKLSRDLSVEMVSVSALTPYARNARTHSRRQIGQIAESIRTFGWTNPILIDGDHGVIAGHCRLEAAKKLGITEVPVIRVEDMSEAQKRAYILADNKLAENAGWDTDMLKIELGDLINLEPDFEITSTGFEMGEIDVILGDDHGAKEDKAAVTDEDLDGPPIAELGDVWCLGRHRLICGDALEPETYAKLLNGSKADLVFTDPPYNVPIAGHVSGLGKKTHGKFAMASGEMSEAEFTDFLKTVFANLADNTVSGSIHFVCMDWRHVAETIAAGNAAYSNLKNICVWAKTNGGMGSLYRSAHELVLVFKSGSAPHINNVALGAHGRYRTNVWSYAGVNSFGSGRDEALEMHPTVKPAGLVADAILDCSKRKGTVLDPFVGSGTTIIAAERTGRVARAIEIDPAYVDVCLRRFHRVTRINPIQEKSGLSLSFLS